VLAVRVTSTVAHGQARGRPLGFPTRRFDGIGELVGQLRDDVATARALVGARAERLALR
jgi:FAD synthase